ncbi:hypothetical protein KP509_24G036800 [Ceratopteris richardii]|uniref:non-specific serine/threonine protein kinase n=1 Tax=Ceratopteris richardii TaxID=49495 RepID=A0A8T2RWT6_CERRI|nr:hypothetical protein KP509_24G036800 [Ceratopteris richardii]KAH7299938.1 hypothetical protein KP509_24G036800 [Ceratopteris richardii]
MPSFEGCLALQTLNLSHNNIVGQIPVTLGHLPNLHSLDLSSNNLTGQIPSALAALKIGASSFANNPGLCGQPLPRCSPLEPVSSHINKPVIIISVAIGGFVILLAFTACIFFWRKGRATVRTEEESLPRGSIKTSSSLPVTTEQLVAGTGGFDERNLIGVGGTSKVYKATLTNGLVVAVKLFDWSTNAEKANYFFQKECETLGKLRHRNLVRVLRTCCNTEMKALVLEYMPCGSLENLLFEGDNNGLSWRMLLNIALDVAQALVYLHHECTAPIIHCDLKPSNIVLDEMYIAHVSDFGIARILEPGVSSYSASYFRGTVGYIAPECAAFSQYSIKGDIYSYGIVLLCMLTGRCPTSEFFWEQGVEMHTWVKQFFPDKYEETLSKNLRMDILVSDKVEEALQLMELALSCIVKDPKQRPTAQQIIRTLVHLKSSKTLSLSNQASQSSHGSHSIISVQSSKESSMTVFHQDQEIQPL